MIEPVDLFGEIPVSLRDVELWLYKVPRLPHHARRAQYAKNWRVAEKIARAKASGELASILGDCLCGFCGQVLCPVPGPAPIDPAAELAALRRRVAVLEVLLTPGKEKPPLGAARGSRGPISAS